MPPPPADDGKAPAVDGAYIAWQQQQIDAAVAATEACRLGQERLTDQVQNDLQAFLAVAPTPAPHAILTQLKAGDTAKTH